MSKALRLDYLLDFGTHDENFFAGLITKGLKSCKKSV